MQDIYDLKCKNIIIIDDYEVQLPLLSVFDRKNIDWGDLAQLFLPKNAVFGFFLYLNWVYCSQLPQNASPITYKSYLHMLHRIFFFNLFLFTQKIQKTANFSHFSVFLGTCVIYMIKNVKILKSLMNMNYSSALFHYLTEKILTKAIWCDVQSPKKLFFCYFFTSKLGKLFPASSK